MWTYLIVLDTAEEDEAKLNLVLLEGGQRDLFTSALGGGSGRFVLGRGGLRRDGLGDVLHLSVRHVDGDDEEIGQRMPRKKRTRGCRARIDGRGVADYRLSKR